MITIIIGKTGCGKSSLGCAIGIKAMDNGCDAVELSKSSLECFPGYKNLNIPKDHLVYSDIFIHGSETSIKENFSYFSTGYRFGLPNDDFEIDYFPYGSTIIFDETRKYWSARKSMSGFELGGTHEKVLEAFELSRQGGLDIYLIMHMTNQVDIQIRSQAHRVIAPESIDFQLVGKKLKHIETIWKGKEFKSIEDYERYIHGEKVEYSDFEYVYHGDIRECYDTEFFRFKWFKGLKKYCAVRLKPCDGTKKSVNNLDKMFSKSVGYKKKEKVVEGKKDEISKSRRTTISYL